MIAYANAYNGGAGRNTACDMAQEICNGVSKDIVKGMGPNKMEKSMRRASKAAAGMHQMAQKVNEVTNVKPTSRVHTHKDSSEEAMMLQDIVRALNGQKHMFTYHIEGQFRFMFICSFRPNKYISAC